MKQGGELADIPAEKQSEFNCTGKRIFVSGHRGLLGQAVSKSLVRHGAEILQVPRELLDLRDEAATYAWLSTNKPDAIVSCAARVGGIADNLTAQADMCQDNLAIATSVIGGAHRAGVNRLVYIASSAVYPAGAPQPLQEKSLLLGEPDPAHLGYAAAKRAGIALCQAYADQHDRSYIAALPTNLYGSRSSSDSRAHVITALLDRFSRAVGECWEEIEIWGTGAPMRDFLHVEDAADGLTTILQKGTAGTVFNVGSGNEISIRELALLLAKITRYDGKIVFDRNKPDGAQRRCLDVSKLMSLGWGGARPIEDGLDRVFKDLTS